MRSRFHLWLRHPKNLEQNEDFRGDPAHGCEPVSPRLNEVEDLESVLPENINLEYNTRQSQFTRPFRSFD
jgi:hypothetical protein